MEQTLDISLLGLLIGLALMGIPLYYFHKYRTGLVKSTIIATARMIVQLVLIGLYLKYLFSYNIWYVNLLWGVIMCAVATFTCVGRTHIKRSILLVPVTVSFFTTALLISIYFLALVLQLQESLEIKLSFNLLFSARYFIPIFGLLLGNMLGVNVLAITTYYESIRRERQMYDYMLGNGATRREATAPFLSAAIRKAFAPCIANMMVMGIVALPGTMIGQILGGSDPNIAIKYQMMIVVITFVASMVSLMVTVSLANRRSFDKYGRMKMVFGK